jgi:hypothetical protein
MRWRWTRDEATDRTQEPIDTVDPESLEVIELDADGHLVGAPRWPADDAIPELPDRPSRRDPTGTAGIWEALAHH